MDLSALIVVLVLSALSLGVLIWLEIYSRRMHREKAAAIEAAGDVKSNSRDRSAAENGINGG